MDRYSKAVLTIIAAALVYLCVIVTPLPRVAAQTTPRPGEFAGPGEVVIVGVRLPKDQDMPVSFPRPVAVNVEGTVSVKGSVTTERSTGPADRVTIVGWERGATPQRQGAFEKIDLVNRIPVAQQ